MTTPLGLVAKLSFSAAHVRAHVHRGEYTFCFACLFQLEFYGPVNTVKVMSNLSINLLICFLERNDFYINFHESPVAKLRFELHKISIQ